MVGGMGGHEEEEGVQGVNPFEREHPMAGSPTRRRAERADLSGKKGLALMQDQFHHQAPYGTDSRDYSSGGGDRGGRGGGRGVVGVGGSPLTAAVAAREIPAAGSPSRPGGVVRGYGYQSPTATTIAAAGAASASASPVVAAAASGGGGESSKKPQVQSLSDALRAKKAAGMSMSETLADARMQQR